MISEPSASDIFNDAVNVTCNMYSCLNKIGLNDIDHNAVIVLFNVMGLNSECKFQQPTPEDFEAAIKRMLDTDPRLFHIVDGVLKCDAEDLKRKYEINLVRVEVCDGVIDSTIRFVESMFPGETYESLVNGESRKDPAKKPYGDMLEHLRCELDSFDYENGCIENVLRFIDSGNP